ncbi:MAG: DNA-binding protein [Clostridia bacterium]|nr:DNA-binding protein [Clostridia bacterium]
MAKDLSVATLLDTYGNMLTPRQCDVVGYYYCDDLSLAEIAENEGITRQAVRDLIRRAVNQLTEMEQKLGFAAKMQTVYSTAKDIRKAAEVGDTSSVIGLCDGLLKE